MGDQIMVKNTQLKLVQGDITDLAVDAIVNAANSSLWMGAGVAGAIKRKGGIEIEKDAVQKGPIEVGEAVVTAAGKLPAKYVIHAAAMGPDLKTDAQKIKAATLNSLKRAEELLLESVAFPALGTGVGGFPMAEAAKIMIGAVKEHLQSSESTLETVYFVLFSEDAFKAFEQTLDVFAQ